MKVITFAIQKGGTGKTTTAISVAVELAEKAHSVLFIDADPQGNATSWIGIEEIEFELADVLLKKCEAEKALIKTQVENLVFLATIKANGNNKNSKLNTYSKTVANESPFAIKHISKALRDKFEFCIIDTSPSFGALESSCLLASDEAITVLKLDEFSKEGLITFITNIESLKERYDTENPCLKKLILNGRDLRLAQQQSFVEEITGSTKSKVYIIPVDQSFSKAQEVHFPIQYLDGVKKQTKEVIKQIASDLENE